MKQLYLLMSILLTAVAADGQKIRFTDTSNVWYESVHTWDMSQMWRTTYKGDSSINGTDYQKLYTLGKSSTNLYLLIREDTLAKKIYYWDDTTERVLYDFSLEVGDTVAYPLGRHYLKSIDSVKIDSFWYKTFYFESATGQFEWPYTVIENIGCAQSLAFPIDAAYRFLGSSRLNCFYNDGVKPVFSKPVESFDNKDSCYTYIIYVSVDDVPNSKALTISPHPANSSSVITFPYTLQKGELIIYNTLGQTVRRVSLSKSSKITVGSLPGVGMYYYKVSDITNVQ